MPSANETEAIDNLASTLDTVLGSTGGLPVALSSLVDAMMLIALLLIPLILTLVMFMSRQPMLGFACALFWGILGAHCYLKSTTPWGDIYFYLFFASMFGMTIFTMLAAYGLREKRDTLGDEAMEEGEGGYVDEGKDELDKAFGDGEPQPSKRTQRLRERAEKRRRGNE